MSNESKAAKIETPKHEPEAPTLLPDASKAQKVQILLALAQPGKPLHSFWRSPTQEVLQNATVELVLAMNEKGKSPIEIQAVCRLVGTANASALRQVFEKNFTLPAGQSRAVAASFNLADLGL